MYRFVFFLAFLLILSPGCSSSGEKTPRKNFSVASIFPASRAPFLKIPALNYRGDCRSQYMGIFKAPRTDNAFLRLRYACARGGYYRNSKLFAKKLYGLLKSKQPAKALEIIRKELPKNILDPRAHLIAYFAARDLNEMKQAQYHKLMVMGVLRSIGFSGDGTTPRTAFHVVNVTEEYMFLSEMRMKYVKRRTRKIGLEFYDVFTVKNKSTGKFHQVYFNASEPLRNLRQSFKKIDASREKTSAE